ncbi:GntR family transcriptional regulator [Sphaerisporangium rubeum]|uniref:DNA-binding GntR family transcriptional regulator n=1 Tax=Sphaerisporangium rubeum TaxID=321317 RepID=A0A7X0MA80_9ACTN|nr:GntR family transcriptional regulator [Sphaerisporangium rubeum]MBB6475716.1 DNA-binding GntR family transcriptional regulator [Sphaerisporangium rubeum]
MAQPLAVLGPARRRLLTDEVTDDVRRAIVSGELKAGERLREDELATRKKVSRGPVREALLRLEQEGLVVIERHRGARVLTLSREDHEHIYSTRRAIEQVAIEYACRNATDDDFERMEEVLRDFHATAPDARTPAAVADCDILFHDAVYLAAHNAPLYRAWESLRSQIHWVLMTRMTLRPDYNIDWESDHRQLLDVLRRRKKLEAQKAFRAHVQGGYERLVTALNDPPGPTPLPAPAPQSATAGTA